MIRKTAEGYTVFARTGRRMGTYRSLARAQERLGQLEAFKANRAPLGRMSPTVRSQSKDGKKGYYVRAKSGRSMGWYATKREAEMRMGQLKAQGAKHFTETRGVYSHSPSGAPTQAAANRLTREFSRAELIAALGLEPEGHTRGQKYNFTTDEFRRKVAFSAVQAAVEARRRLGIG